MLLDLALRKSKQSYDKDSKPVGVAPALSLLGTVLVS